MRKSIVAGLAIAFLITCALAIPVMAESPKAVPAVLSISGAKDLPVEKEWTTEGGIVHQQGIIRTAVATIKIGEVTYVGAIHAVVDKMTNTKTSLATNHYHKWTISFPVQTGLAQSGEFVGTNVWTYETNPTYLQGHAVLQGSGAFEGQTLKIEVEYPPSIKWYGYLIP